MPARILSEDIVIDVLAPVEKEAGYCRIAFRASAIDHLAEINGEASAIALQSGAVIPVALPFDALKEKIYDPDLRESGGGLDLRAVTGDAAKNLAAPPLAKTFNAEAEKNEGEEKPFMITTLLRQTASTRTAVFTFRESDIQTFEPQEDGDSVSGESVLVTFNGGFEPFQESAAILDMPYDDFISFLATAKRKGNALDLLQPFSINHNRYGVVTP